METQKNDEKNIVLELKHQLGRMMVQVDYMYRNDRDMSRLDLDIMMEHTRDLYELLLDYQADKIEVEPKKHEAVETEINEGGELINRDVEFEIETPTEVMSEPDVNGENDGDDEGLNVEEKPEEIKHVLDISEDDEDEEDWEDEDDEMFHVEEPINVDDYEDSPMIIPPSEEDNSLAARLQRTHIDDIRLAIGINDKMMIINDLFGGSFERYSKSITALNEFPTLSGAKVYMNELQIELQWDTESQAYKMLNDLVERRFV